MVYLQVNYFIASLILQFYLAWGSVADLIYIDYAYFELKRSMFLYIEIQEASPLLEMVLFAASYYTKTEIVKEEHI